MKYIRYVPHTAKQNARKAAKLLRKRGFYAQVRRGTMPTKTKSYGGMKVWWVYKGKK